MRKSFATGIIFFIKVVMYPVEQLPAADMFRVMQYRITVAGETVI